MSRDFWSQLTPLLSVISCGFWTISAHLEETLALCACGQPKTAEPLVTLVSSMPLSVARVKSEHRLFPSRYHLRRWCSRPIPNTFSLGRNSADIFIAFGESEAPQGWRTLSAPTQIHCLALRNTGYISRSPLPSRVGASWMKTVNLTINKTAREAQTDSGSRYFDCIWKMKDVRGDTPPDDSPETKIQRATVQNSSIGDSCPLCWVIPDFISPLWGQRAWNAATHLQTPPMLLQKGELHWRSFQRLLRSRYRETCQGNERRIYSLNSERYWTDGK